MTALARFRARYFPPMCALVSLASSLVCTIYRILHHGEWAWPLIAAFWAFNCLLADIREYIRATPPYDDDDNDDTDDPPFVARVRMRFTFTTRQN